MAMDVHATSIGSCSGSSSNISTAREHRLLAPLHLVMHAGVVTKRQNVIHGNLITITNVYHLTYQLDQSKNSLSFRRPSITRVGRVLLYGWISVSEKLAMNYCNKSIVL